MKQERQKLYHLIEKAMNLLPEKHIWKIQIMKEDKNKTDGEIGEVHLLYMNEVTWEIFKNFWKLTEEEKLNAIGHEIGHILIDDLYILSQDRHASKDAIYDCNEKTATQIGMIVSNILNNKKKLDK